MTFHHKNIRLRPADYLGQRAYFVTVCCDEHRPVFTDLGRGRWLLDQLTALSAAQQMAVHAYCVMPDHAHALLQGTALSSNLLRWMKDFKQITAYHYKRETGAVLWQKKYYDHVLRSGEAIEAVAWYIWLNPLRQGLVMRPEDYPLSGSQTLPWPQNHLPIELWTPHWKKRS